MKIVNHVKEKINCKAIDKHQFVIIFFQLSEFYNFKYIQNETLDYINRWFKKIAKTKNFQQLNFNNVKKILSSSKLKICSELEVFIASDFWLSCESFNRNKFAKDLLLKTRFPLLSDHVIKSLLEQGKDSSSVFHKNKECLVLIDKILKNKEDFYRNRSIVYQTNRYCNSSKFNIVLCGKYNKRPVYIDFKLHLLEAENLAKVKTYIPCDNLRVVGASSITNEIYFVFRNKDNEYKEKLLFIKHSPVLKTWEDLDFYYDFNLRGFCMCSFLDSIFIIGGCYRFGYTNIDMKRSCVVFNTITKKWKEASDMNDYRTTASCTVFEGRIVVSGGINDRARCIRTVETYDHVADTWTFMPNMVNKSYKHNLIAMSNKLFAFGCGLLSNFCEVYDKMCKKFVVIKSPPKFAYFNVQQAVSVGKVIMVFRIYSTKMAIYDTDKNEWSVEPFEVTKNVGDFYCGKVPSLKCFT